MSPRTANRLWMAWSLFLLAATAGTLWVSTRIGPEIYGHDILAPARSSMAQFDGAKALIEPIAPRLKESADEVSRIARRQLPRPPFGLVEPPFVKKMREREEALLATLAGIGDHLQETKQLVLDLREEIKKLDSSIKSGLDEAEYQIGILREILTARSFVSGIALAVIAAAAAVSTFVLAWLSDRREQPGDRKAA